MGVGSGIFRFRGFGGFGGFGIFQASGVERFGVYIEPLASGLWVWGLSALVLSRGRGAFGGGGGALRSTAFRV